MNYNLKYASQSLIIGATVTLGYLSFFNYFKESLLAVLAFLVLALIHHIKFDDQVNKVFFRVTLVFIFATLMRLGFSYLKIDVEVLIYFAQLFIILGFFLVVQEMFKEIEIRVSLNIYSILSILVILANIVLTYFIVALINKFELGLSHTAFDFIFTIINTFILSIGMIGYFLSIRKSKRVTLLFVAIALFLIGDLFDTINYLFFIDDLISEALFLQNMFSVIALYFFYKYCVYPKEEFVV